MEHDIGQPGPDRCLSIRELDQLIDGAPATGSNLDRNSALCAEHARAHLAVCPACRVALEEVKQNHGMLLRLARRAISAALPSTHSSARATALAATSPCALPLAVPGFRLLEEIQHGGQGTVFRAIHEASGRTAAVKVLITGSARRRARMEREAQLAAALSHPNIVTLLDCCDLPDGRYALAMEFIDGESLDRWARAVDASAASPRQKQRRKLEAFAKICAALQHAHQRGVIHRDLKPDNILVDEKDEPHVLDFGVACRADRGAEREAPGRVTATGELACTLAYASPEQVSGDQSRIDSRSDVYALGRILYELLTGRPPYPCDGAIAEVLEAITNREPESMRRRSDGTSGDRRGDDRAPVSKDLEIITLSALAKDPQHRIQTAAALHDDVRCVLSGDAISARRDSVLYVLRKALRRHRAPLAAVAVAVAGLLAGGVAITASALSSARAASRAALEEARMQVEAERSQTIAAVLRRLVPAEGRTADFGSSSESHRAIVALSERLESSLFCNDLEGAATTRMLLGGVCLDRGAPRMAEEQLRIAVRHLSLRESPEDEKLAAAMHGLAAVLLARREFVEAEERTARAIALREALLGREHPATLESMALLARTQLARGRTEDAERTCSEAASLRGGESGLARLAGASIVEAQAEIALVGGRCDEALALARRAVRTWLRERGDFDPGLPQALATLARAAACSSPDSGANSGAGLATTARELASLDSGALTAHTLQTLLELKADLLAPDDPDRLETLALLIPRLRAGGELADALATADEAIGLATRLYGHVDLRLADLLLERASLRHTLHHPGDPTGTEDVWRRLAILRCLLPGVDDFYLSMSMRQTAEHLYSTGAVEESGVLREEALDLLRCRFGPQSRELAWSSALWGTNLWEQGETQAGILLLEESLAQLHAIDPETNYYAARVHGWLGRALIDVGRFGEGRWHLERGAAMRNGSVEQAKVDRPLESEAPGSGSS